MQYAEAKFTQSGLLLALRRYSSAVRDMEQTVLLPSLLRDVPSDEAWDTRRDLHANYLMLKAIRNTVEGGPIRADDHETKSLGNHLEALMDTDPETLLRFHLKGLFSVMSELTDKTQSLTDKYMDMIGLTS